jgi:hypothetical protein
MKTETAEKTKKINTLIADSAAKSRETVQDILNINNQFLDQAIHSNKVLVDNIRNQFPDKGLNAPVFENIHKAFGKSVELSEETIDQILDVYNKQLKRYVDYTSELVNTLQENFLDGKNKAAGEKMLKLIQENLEQSLESLDTQVKSLLDSYNKHANLAINFNKKFGENIQAQLELCQEIHSKSMGAFTNWATEWWKYSEVK